MFLIKKLIYLLFCKVFYSVKFVNKNLERNIDRCIIFPNHVSFEDSVILYSNSKSVAVMAKAEMFKNKIIGKILTIFGVFPIHRERKDVRSLLHAVNILKDKKFKKLIIFPEGTRVKIGTRIPPKLGAVYIALKTELPILPVRIIMSDKRKIFKKITVIYDTPIYLDSTKIKDKEYINEMSQKILDSVYNLKESDKKVTNKK